MTSLDRITSDPATMNGQACIRGMRITVQRVLEALSIYPDRQDFFFPSIQSWKTKIFVKPWPMQPRTWMTKCWSFTKPDEVLA